LYIVNSGAVTPAALIVNNVVMFSLSDLADVSYTWVLFSANTKNPFGYR
jgi:hypothetical protein